MSNWIYLSVFAAAIAVYAMMDVLRARISNSRKLVWFAIVTLVPLVGPLVYLARREAIVAGDGGVKH